MQEKQSQAVLNAGSLFPFFSACYCFFFVFLHPHVDDFVTSGAIIVKQTNNKWHEM